jgi:hypothetical protein
VTGLRQIAGAPLFLRSGAPELLSEQGSESRRSGAVAPVLLLWGYGNILMFRSVTGRTMKWAQAHFFVAAGGDEHSTGLGRGVFK